MTHAADATGSAFSIGLIGASGGLGTSTLAAALATRAALAGRSTVLIDLDRGGGGADLLLGCEREPGPRWADLAGASGRVDPQVLLHRLPRSEHDVAVLTGDRHWYELPAGTVEAVRGPLFSAVDVAVLDLGRTTPEWTAQLDAVLLTVGGTVTALGAAEVAADRLRQGGVGPWMVTRGLERRWHPAVSEALQLTVLATLPEDRRTAEDNEIGLPPGSRDRSSLARRSDEILRDLLVERAAVS